MTTPDALERVTIDTTSTDSLRLLQASWTVLMDLNDEVTPEVLRRGDRLVRVVATDDGAARLAAYERPELEFRLINVARFVRYTANGDERPTNVDERVLNMLLRNHLQLEPLAPRVTRVTTAPVFDAGGRLVAEPGYHPDSGLFYSPDPQLVGVDWTRFLSPDEGVVQWAVSTWLGENGVLVDFPFASDADRANALALMLLPFVRELITGPTPVHAVIAPTPGTGKTLLVQALLYPSCGPTPVYAEPRSDEEWRKALTTYLLTSPAAITFDNVARMDSPALAAAVTSPTCTWTDRVLGASEQALMQVRCAWVTTGNNISLTTEQARRVVPILLDPTSERPWQRTTFRHPDLLRYVSTGRRELVGSALALSSYWLRGQHDEALGRRAGSLVIGSFEHWARVLGGLLADAGVPGFLTNHATFAEDEDTDNEDVAEFLQAWRAHASEPISARELEALLTPGIGALSSTAPASLRGHRADRLPEAIGLWCRAHKGRVAGALRLERAGRKWVVREL